MRAEIKLFSAIATIGVLSAISSPLYAAETEQDLIHKLELQLQQSQIQLQAMQAADKRPDSI